MSFQGDVRGIGLAELLQGLARGRKEGILTLTSKAGLRSVIGLEEGNAFLLPDADEDVERWRDRVRDAWAEDPNFRIDYLRMSEIARAQRLEDLYRLLDGGGVHFRFEPGELPRRGTGASLEGPDSLVYCEGTPVEFMLLEYARLADELETAQGAFELPDDAIPSVLDPNASPRTPAKLIEQCNGNSTLQEIGDRLGWAIRQVRLEVLPALQASALRFAAPSELLGLALHELSHKNFSRAARRLAGWTRDSRPGPMTFDEAEALGNEWLAGRLTAALRGMTMQGVRTLLRRLDHTLANSSTAVVHWLEAQRVDKSDRIVRMRRLAAEFGEGSDPERPSVRELLDLAREFRDAGHPWRSTPLLVMAAAQQPTSTTLQIEIGIGLVAAGRAQEAGPWILTGCKDLLEAGHADRAVAALRTLLTVDVRNREARQLLSRARRSSTQVKKLRKNLLIGLAGASAFSLAAVMKVRKDQQYERRIAEVRSMMMEPEAAFARLKELFPGDKSIEVRTLADNIQERQRYGELELRDEWLAQYQAAQVEGAKGDPVAAIDRIRNLPQPPSLKLVREPWPLRKDLYTGIVEHLLIGLDELGRPIEGSPQQLGREEQIEEQVKDIRENLAESALPPEEFRNFLVELERVDDRLADRRREREALMSERLRKLNMEEQDRLLALAEAHAANGDYIRALRYYNDILEMDKTGKIRPVLAPRIRDVQKKADAVDKARRLAERGEHEKAFALLDETFEDPYEFIVPWEVKSYPEGATVKLDSGRIYTTPFEIETTFNEVVTMTFELEGFVQKTLEVKKASDQVVYLSRVPDRFWESDGRIDAIPVAVDGDHIVCDRKGQMVRVGPDGEIVWRHSVDSISGISRAPVFMPHRTGSLLLVTEEGQAYIVEAESGHLQGPWDLGSAPSIGPAPSGGHVRLRLTDGRVALWKDSLKPLLEDDAATVDGFDEPTYRHGATNGFAVMRRASEASEPEQFVCPWGDGWRVDISERAYYVYQKGKRPAGYTVERTGDWTFLAWESATARAPEGRLWVSDEAGLRAYVP